MMLKTVSSTWGLFQVLQLMFLPMMSPLLQPEDHHLLRYYAAIMRVVRPVLHRVFMSLQCNGSRSLKEFLFDQPDYSNKRYKGDFGPSERVKLDDNEASDSFDITLLYKLLQKVCGLSDTQWNIPGTLENSLKLLKNHRNILAHEEISFNQNELLQQITELEELCRNALEKTALQSHQDLTVDIAEMEKGLKEVLSGGIDLWEPYREALLELRNRQTAVLIREGRSDVRNLGNRLRILNPFAWLLDTGYSHLDIEHIFTELEMEGRGKVELQCLLTTKLPSGELPDTVIISGPPGIGKTSLARFLVYDWLCANPVIHDIEDIELLLPVELRHVCSNNVEQLVRNEILSSAHRHLKNDDIIATLRNISIVWLLDGYDEAKLKTRDVIKEIFKLFPNSKVLITTRTEFKHEIENLLNGLHLHPMSVDVKGFSTNNVEKCTKKLINVYVKNVNEREKIHENFVKFIHEYELINQEIFRVPLFLTMILVLWLDSPDKFSSDRISSSAYIYCLIIDFIVNKMITRDSFEALNKRKSVLQKKIHSFLDELGKILWKDSYELSLLEYEVDYLEEKCNELGLPFKECMSPFFVFTEKATPTGVKEEYTIIHRTFKEFLGPRSFSNIMINKEWDFYTTAEEWFTSIRDILKQYEPSNRMLEDKFDLENLSQEEPLDEMKSYHRKQFLFSSRTYFAQDTHCTTCTAFVKTDDIPNYFMRYKDWGYVKAGTSRSTNFKCHINDHMSGWDKAYIIGYLKVKQELNDTRAKQLAFSCFKLMGGHTCEYYGFHMYMKEGENTPFVGEFSRYIEQITWSFFHGQYFDSAKQLLHYVVPRSVFLHYCPEVKVDSNQFLKDCIGIFSKLPVEIHLDLSYFMVQPSSGIEYTKECLELLLNETSCSQLVSLRCPLDGTCLRLLEKASDIQEMCVRYWEGDLFPLLVLVKNLPALQSMSLAMNPDIYIEKRLPLLDQEHRKLSFLSLVLPNVLNVKPQKVGLAIRKISEICVHLGNIIFEGVIDEVNPENLLNFLFKIFSQVKHANDIEIILDVKNNTHLIHQMYVLSKVEQSFKKNFSNSNLLMYYALHGIPTLLVFSRSPKMTLPLKSTKGSIFGNSTRFTAHAIGTGRFGEQDQS